MVLSDEMVNVIWELSDNRSAVIVTDFLESKVSRMIHDDFSSSITYPSDLVGCSFIRLIFCPNINDLQWTEKQIQQIMLVRQRSVWRRLVDEEKHTTRALLFGYALTDCCFLSLTLSSSMGIWVYIFMPYR